jgi:hypothetical protein
MLSLDQVTQALQNLVAQSRASQATITLAQVEAVVNETSAASSTTDGVLYSGRLTDANGNLVEAGDIANGIAEHSDGRFSTIDMTDRGRLVFGSGDASRPEPANVAFRDALAEVARAENPGFTAGQLDSAVNDMIYRDPVNGFGGQASAVYARSLTGEVMVIAGDTARVDRTLNLVELPIIAENAQSINNLSASEAAARLNTPAADGSNALLESARTVTTEINAAGGFVELPDRAAHRRTYARRHLSTRVRGMQRRAVARKTQPKISPTKCNTRDICP